MTSAQFRQQSSKKKTGTKNGRKKGDEFVNTVIFHLEREFGTGWIKEHRFDTIRRFRFDICHMEHRVAIESDGAVFAGGRHTRGSGFVKDIDKLNLATSHGWRVFRIYPQGSIADLIDNIKRLLKD